MEEILKELDLVFKMVSGMMVCGDNADVVAASRAKLRNIYSKLQMMDMEMRASAEINLNNEGQEEL